MLRSRCSLWSTKYHQLTPSLNSLSKQRRVRSTAVSAAASPVAAPSLLRALLSRNVAELPDVPSDPDASLAASRAIAELSQAVLDLEGACSVFAFPSATEDGSIAVVLARAPAMPPSSGPSVLLTVGKSTRPEKLAGAIAKSLSKTGSSVAPGMAVEAVGPAAVHIVLNAICLAR
jgi:hypothetical protein